MYLIMVRIALVLVNQLLLPILDSPELFSACQAPELAKMNCIPSVVAIGLPQQLRVMSSTNPLWNSALDEISYALGNSIFIANHSVEGELAKVLRRDVTELAVVVAGRPIVQLLMVSIDELQRVRGEVGGKGEF